MNDSQLRSMYQRFSGNPELFRNSLNIESSGRMVRFSDVSDDWQRSDFAAMDAGWLRCLGRTTDDTATMRAFLERPRGHSKSFDLAISCVFALLTSSRPIKGHAYAASKAQATILRDSVLTLARNNPWMLYESGEDRNRKKWESGVISVHNLVVKVANTRHPGFESELRIESSLEATSWGTLPDFVVADELTHWPESGEKLWHSILSSTAKKSNCVLVVISNAGRGQGSSWQWDVREQARESDSWYFSRLDGPQASWITEKNLEEQRRALPPKVFARLWQNEWQVESGDALDHEAVRRCITLPGPHPSPQENYVYLASVDFSLTRDWSALVILGLNMRNGMIDVAEMRNWNPKQYGGRLHLGTVKDDIIKMCRRFRVRKIMLDPWQAARLKEELTDVGFTISMWNSNSDYLHKQAVCLLDLINDQRIAFYDDRLLIDDLMRARIDQQRANDKYKLTWPRTETGHCDRGCALVQSLPWVKSALESLLFNRHHQVPEEILIA